MPQAVRAPALILTAAMLMLLTSGCSTPPQSLPAGPVQPARIPALPESARQPPNPCSPWQTCSAKLQHLRETWLQQLTPPELPASGAKSTSTP